MEVFKLQQTAREFSKVSDAHATIAKDADSFIETLPARNNQTIDQTITESDAPESFTPQLNNVVVTRYLKALDLAQLDRNAFEMAFDTLSKDKAVGAAEADMIFKIYHGRKKWHKIYGDKHRWHKKSDALDAIKISFIERLTQEQKQSQVAKATPW